MKISRSPKRFIALLLSAPILIGILQCGPGTSIEQQGLDTGESIVLKFDGPFSYSYKSVGNPVAKTYKSESKDEIQLLNNYSDSDPQDSLEESLLASVGITYDNKLSFILGPDMKVKTENGATVVPEGFDTLYKEKAYITNLKHPEDGALSFDSPIEFSKNLVGAQTIRREKFCADANGNAVASFNNTAVPNLSCQPYHHMKDTGKTLTFDYSVEQLRQLLGTSGDRKNSFIYQWKKGDPLTITLKNIHSVELIYVPLKPIYNFTPLEPAEVGNGATPGESGDSGSGTSPGGSNPVSPGDSGNSNVAGAPEVPANSAPAGNVSDGQAAQSKTGCVLQASDKSYSADAWAWFLFAACAVILGKSRLFSRC